MPLINYISTLYDWPNMWTIDPISYNSEAGLFGCIPSHHLKEY